jgi:IS5 family transposase
VGRSAETLTADRGYKGKTKIGNTRIQIPKPFNSKTLNSYQQRKLRKQFKRRAAIEPIIGHLKSDHRLGRNFYKGITGDSINVLLAAAAFNFKRMMNIYKKILAHIIKIIQASICYKLYPCWTY